MLWHMESEADKKLLMRIYENCWKARFLDEALRQLLPAEFPRSFFSGYGSELGPSVISLLLKKEDYLIPHYRGFAAFLGKGIAPERIVGEFLRKKTGTTHGLGDSTAFRDPALGIPGYSINLGAMFAVSIGLALAVKSKRENRIVVHCFGDGEASRTTFGSALNLGSLWRLPILFVCLNNYLSIETRLEDMSSTKNIADRADGYSMEKETLSDDQPVPVYERTQEIMAKIRKDGRPVLLEIREERFTPHSSRYTKDINALPSIPEKKDSVLLLEKALSEKFGIELEKLHDLKNGAASSIRKAISIAEAGGDPSLEDFLAIYRES